MGCNLSCCFSPLLLSPTWKTEARLASTRCPCNEVVTITGCEGAALTRPDVVEWMPVLQPPQPHTSEYTLTWLLHREEVRRCDRKGGFSSISSPQLFHAERGWHESGPSQTKPQQGHTPLNATE